VFYSKNKFEKLVHLVGFVIRIYHEARSPERQITRTHYHQTGHPHHTVRCGHPTFYTMGTGSFPEVKRPGLDVEHPPTFIADIKDRVELYLYYFSGSSLTVLGWILALDDFFRQRFQSVTCMGSSFYLAHPLGHFLSAASSYGTWLGIQSPEPDLSQTFGRACLYNAYVK